MGFKLLYFFNNKKLPPVEKCRIPWLNIHVTKLTKVDKVNNNACTNSASFKILWTKNSKTLHE